MGNLEIYGLLLTAISAGWLLGKLGNRSNKQTGDGLGSIFHDYFVGLNYLLNDEPDEAIDTFIKALEINSETIETHLALGALLRRRGTVDKAIKVHQTLLARPGLEADMADAARIQLAQDYITGGLLDRAERLLKELMQENSVAKWEALQLLITIYQTEKEWESAVACTQELLSNARYKKDSDWNARAAHYCCEIAEQFIDKEENGKARDSIKRAFGFRRHSVRAAVLLARIEQRLGNFKAANREYLRIMQQNPAFVPQILKAMRKSFAAIDKLPDFKHSLSDHVSNHFDPVALNMLVQLITESDGSEAAIRFLRMKIASEPSVTAATQLLKLEAGLQEEAQATDLERIHQMLENMLKKRAGYQCNQCGYESKNLYWLCPSCHTWDSIEPNYKNGI